MQQHPRIGDLTLTGWGVPDKYGYPVLWVCACGKHGHSKFSDMKLAAEDGEPHSCKSCAMRRRMAGKVGSEEHAAHMKRLCAAAAAAVAAKAREADAAAIAKILIGAKARCENREKAGYKNYGGRGIRFRFDTIEQGVTYILGSIGPKPAPGYSLDRIDNDGDYTPGNLRWATHTEQMNNRRAWANGAVGARVLELQQRGCQFSYESIRTFVRQGYTDEEILSRAKSTSGRPRVRHRKLWASAPVCGERETDS